LFYFYHWDDAPPGAEPTPGIATKRNAHFYAVRGGASTKLSGIEAAKAEMTPNRDRGGSRPRTRKRLIYLPLPR